MVEILVVYRDSEGAKLCHININNIEDVKMIGDPDILIGNEEQAGHSGLLFLDQESIMAGYFVQNIEDNSRVKLKVVDINTGQQNFLTSIVLLEKHLKELQDIQYIFFKRETLIEFDLLGKIAKIYIFNMKKGILLESQLPLPDYLNSSVISQIQGFKNNFLAITSKSEEQAVLRLMAIKVLKDQSELCCLKTISFGNADIISMSINEVQSDVYGIAVVFEDRLEYYSFGKNVDLSMFAVKLYFEYYEVIYLMKKYAMVLKDGTILDIDHQQVKNLESIHGQ